MKLYSCPKPNPDIVSSQPVHTIFEEGDSCHKLAFLWHFCSVSYFPTETKLLLYFFQCFFHLLVRLPYLSQLFEYHSKQSK